VLGAGGSGSSGFSSSLGGIGEALSGMLGGAGGAGIGGMLQDVLGDAGKALGGENNLAIGGLGALAGALLGGGGSSVKGALGGGIMAVLGAMAYSAFKGAGEKPGAQEIPVGLRQPETREDEEELEKGAELILKAMINAAKADGQIDNAEIERIVGKLESSGAGSEARDFVINEMNKPMDLNNIIASARGNPHLAAQVYAASLLAIEVDTPAERQYMQQLAQGLGLPQEVIANLEKTVGL